MKNHIKLSIIRTAEFAKNPNVGHLKVHVDDESLWGPKTITNGDELFGEYVYKPYQGTHGKIVDRWQRTGTVNVLKEDAILSLDEDLNFCGVYGELVMTQNKIHGIDGKVREFLSFRETERTIVRK